MTNQELFDFVCLNVIEQGEPSVDEKGACKYRGPNGLKCAAGFLLTDEQAEGCEGLELGYVIDDYPEFEDLWDVNLVSLLQLAHDQSADSESFTSVFVEKCLIIAERFNLSTKILEETNV